MDLPTKQAILDQASLEGMAGAVESPPPSLPQSYPAITQKSSCTPRQLGGMVKWLRSEIKIRK
jgi:hypothetical protein